MIFRPTLDLQGLDARQSQPRRSLKYRNMVLKIPDGLAASCRKAPERAAWLGRLPELVERLMRLWELKNDTPLDAADGTCSYVAAVVTNDRTPAVLKVALPHMEGEQEIEGLRFWNGDAMVRLLRADEDLGAMMLERCEPGTTLLTRPEYEQDVVIADLLRRLWRPASSLASGRFRPLSTMLRHWSEETLAQAERWFDAGVVREGLRLFEELPRSAAREVLLVTDLHASNVLAAEREPWLGIDPKPFVGEPAYDATQHLFNCFDRLRSEPEKTIRRLADLLDVEYERLRLWTFARVAAEPRNHWTSAELELARAIRP
jgi:streptomycin 6-kinase